MMLEIALSTLLFALCSPILAQVAIEAREKDAAPAAGAEIPKVWVGPIEINGTRQILHLHNDSYRPRITFSSRPEHSIVVADIRRNAGRITFDFPYGDGTCTLSGALGDGAFNGAIQGCNLSGSFQLVPVVPVAHETYDTFTTTYRDPAGMQWLFLRNGTSYQYLKQDRCTHIFPIGEGRFLSEQDEYLVFAGEQITVQPHGQAAYTLNRTHSTQAETVHFASGPYALEGTLIKPRSAGPHPVVVLTHGSLNSERHYYLSYAYHLAEHGIAALVYDKRGSGRSTGEPNKASLSDLADDALAALSYLESRPDIDRAKTGIWGLSQGGWIVALAAARSSAVDFAIAVSGPGVNIVQQETYRIDQLYRDLGMTPTLRDSGGKFWKLSFDLAIAVRKGELPDIFGGRDVLGADLDPVPLWQQVQQPVLLLYGDNDKIIPPAESALRIQQALAHANNQRVTIRRFADSNHELLLSDTGSQLEQPRQRTPGVNDTITTWIDQHIVHPGPAAPASAIDLDIAPDPAFQAGGRYDQLPWYGRARIQLGLLLGFALVALFGLVSIWFRPHDAANNLSAIINLLTLVMLGGFIAMVGAVFLPSIPRQPPAWLALMPIVAWLTAGLACVMLYLIVQGWNSPAWSNWTRSFLVLFSVVNLLFIGWMSYWRLLGLRT